MRRGICRGEAIASPIWLIGTYAIDSFPFETESCAIASPYAVMAFPFNPHHVQLKSHNFRALASS